MVTRYGMGVTRLESMPLEETLMLKAWAKPKTRAESMEPTGSPAPMAWAARAMKPRPATMSRDQPME